MTMINFKRTGGILGKEIGTDFDLSSMPASVAQRLHNLINESNFFEIPVVEDLQASPDEYEYLITVVAGNSIHTVRVSDTSMPKSIRPLVEQLTELAKATT
ncbi:MAG TPA: protealysin inhibitor emfourin [Anaerolineales bacterium]